MLGSGTHDIKLVVVGDGGVGKTSMLMSYTTGGFIPEYIPTFFDTFDVSMTFKENRYSVNLVDTAGQVTYDRLRTLAYYDTDVFILCFSVACPDSFENIRTRWIPELKEFKPDTPFILVGTQVDLRDHGHKRGSRKGGYVTKGRAMKWARRFGALCYMECSALSQEGVKKVFQEALNQTLSPRRENNILQSFKRFFWKI